LIFLFFSFLHHLFQHVIFPGSTSLSRLQKMIAGSTVRNTNNHGTWL